MYLTVPPCAAPIGHHTGCSGLILTCSKNAGVETAAPTEQAQREQKMGWDNCCPRSWVPRGWWHSSQWFCSFESISHVSQANLELDFELEILLPPPPGGLALQTCTICGAGDGAQVLLHARQVLYPRIHILVPLCCSAPIYTSH